MDIFSLHPLFASTLNFFQHSSEKVPKYKAKKTDATYSPYT